MSRQSTKETLGLRKAATTIPSDHLPTEMVTEWDSGIMPISALTDTAVMEPPHHMEKRVRRELMSQSDLRFSSLVVRRMGNGVLLEGVMEQVDDAPDVVGLVRALGIDRVINRLVVRQPVPSK